MFYALAEGRVETEGLHFRHELSDIESLNRRAMAGELAVTAVSFHAYAHLADRYLLLPHGASFGDGYGPVVVAREPIAREAIAVGRGRRRVSRSVDHGGARAAAVGAGRLHRASRVRSDPGRGRVGTPARGPPDPRGAADVSRRGADGNRGSRTLVERGDRPSAAARRQRRAAGPGRGAHRPHLPGAFAVDRVRPRPPLRRPRPRDALRPRPCPARRPTGSSGCTSTPGRRATARPGGGPCRPCSTGRTRRA